MDDEPKKFLLTMAALTPELRVVARKIFDLDPELRYEALKELIITKTKKPENKRIQQLLNGAEIGDRRPSDYLNYLRQLMGEKKEENGTILRTIFLNNLPAQMRPIVAATKAATLDEHAETADKIFDLMRPQATLNAIRKDEQHLTQKHAAQNHTLEISSLRLEVNGELHKLQLAASHTKSQIESLQTSLSLVAESMKSLQIELQRLSYSRTYTQPQQPYTGRGRSQSRGPPNSCNRTGETPHSCTQATFNTRSDQSRAASPHSTNPEASTLCWYHATYGQQARSCHAPCSWGQGNLQAA
jgi:hypothetical protein